MQERDELFVRHSGYEEHFNSIAEKENLANHLMTLRRITWDVRAKICQLEGACEDMIDLKADMLSLQAQLNSLAENLGLQRIPDPEDQPLRK